MARKFNIQIESHVDEVLEAKKEAVERVLEQWGLVAEGHAKLYCPVDTGRLRNSIDHAADEDTMYVGTNVEYAAYVEMGTSRMKAQPYLEPSLANHLDEYRQIAEQELKG